MSVHVSARKPAIYRGVAAKWGIAGGASREPRPLPCSARRIADTGLLLKRTDIGEIGPHRTDRRRFPKA